MIVADLAEVVRLQPARGERGRADSQPGRDGRRARVERDGVAVDGDADVVQPVLGLLAVEVRVAQVDQHQVHVGAAGQHVHAAREQLLAHDPRARARALLALAEQSPTTRSSAPPPCPAITCISGPPCWPGKTAELIFFAHSSLQRIIPPRAPPIVLWIVVETTSE